MSPASQRSPPIRAAATPPAFVVGELPPREAMQQIAREVGYSETVFLAGDGGGDWQTRYFSPEAEVAFCGHATIAGASRCTSTAATRGSRSRPSRASCASPSTHRGRTTLATLTSVKPHVGEIGPGLLGAAARAARALARPISIRPAGAARVRRRAPPDRRARAAARRTRGLEYDFDGLRALMLRAGLDDVQVIWRASPTSFRARNPFPVGGVVEDPATGAAAAALGAYLREIGAVTPPATIEVLQGEEIGRPSQLRVTIPARGGIDVSGTAVRIPPALA